MERITIKKRPLRMGHQAHISGAGHHTDKRPKRNKKQRRQEGKRLCHC